MVDHADATRRRVLVVTDDAKDDWWLKKDGLHPAPQMVAEFAERTGHPHAPVTAEEFLRLAQRLLALGENAAAVEGTAKVASGRDATTRRLARWRTLGEAADEMAADPLAFAVFDSPVERVSAAGSEAQLRALLPFWRHTLHSAVEAGGDEQESVRQVLRLRRMGAHLETDELLERMVVEHEREAVMEQWENHADSVEPDALHDGP